MKQLSIFIGTFTIFYTTACSNTASITTPLVQNQHHAKISINDGGNPEVYNRKMNLCFSLKKRAKSQCLEQIYKDIDIVVLQENDKPIILAGRGTLKEKSIRLRKEDRRILIYIDTKNIKQPIELNVTPFKKAQNGDRVIFDIAKESIKEDTLTLKDREGKLLLKYKIIRP